MPKGKSIKSQKREQPPVIKPPMPPALPAIPASITKINKEQGYAIERALAEVGHGLRQRIIEESPDLFETLIALSKGITVQTLDKEGAPAVYVIPPHWPALKYLLDWGRLLMKVDPTPTKNLHGLDDETKELLKEWMQAPAERPPMPSLVDGAFVLGTVHEKPAGAESYSDDDDETDPDYA